MYFTFLEKIFYNKYLLKSQKILKPFFMASSPQNTSQIFLHLSLGEMLHIILSIVLAKIFLALNNIFWCPRQESGAPLGLWFLGEEGGSFSDFYEYLGVTLNESTADCWARTTRSNENRTLTK